MFLKKLITLIAVARVVLLLQNCHKRETSSDAATETIAPAQPQPAETGSDAMTQTVDIEDSRSEADGASLNKSQPATGTTATVATTTTTTTSTKTAPVKPPKKQ